MVRVPMILTTMELLPLVCLCVLTWSGSTSADGNGPDVVVNEGEDAILPCSLSTKEDITSKLFDWKKDDQKEVFFYDAGVTYNNGRTGQNKLFSGRVFHFPDQLKVGNASIVIKQSKVTDSGNYTCDFPRLPPPRLFHIELVVDSIKRLLKDRTKENIQGAARKPYVTVLKVTKDNAVLQCEVQGAFPKPQLQWQDSAGNNISAEEQVTPKGDRYNIILQTTVTKTDNYSCVVTQKEINHTVHTETYVNISGAVSKPSIKTLEQTQHIAVLQCEVQGAFPKPQLQWQDRGGNIVPAEKPQVTESEGRYDVILQTTVTKTDTYRCVVTQKEINHTVHTETYVNISGSHTGLVVGLVVAVLLCGVLLAILVCCWYKKRRRRQNDLNVSEPMKP